MKLSLFFWDNFHDPILKWNFAKHVTNNSSEAASHPFLLPGSTSRCIGLSHGGIANGLFFKAVDDSRKRGTFSERIGSR